MEESIPYISFIVPVYNVEPYLKRCVDSILEQTFNDFELILVDDKSPDNSGEICDKYASKDMRVKVIHKKQNEGLGAARNSGLDICKGNYIIFVDSDDFLTHDGVLKVVSETAKKSLPDVILYSYKKFFEATNTYSGSIIKGISEESGIDYLVRSNAYKALGCNKMVKHSLIEKLKLRFPTGVLGEDLPWCVDLLVNADKIIFCNVDFFAYRQRTGSITDNSNKNFRRQNIQDTLSLIEGCAKKYGIYGNELNERSIIGHFLAYEYSWVLGAVSPYWTEFKPQMEALSFLLKCCLNDKASKVNKLHRLLGLRLTSFVLYTFINLRAVRSRRT